MNPDELLPPDGAAAPANHDQAPAGGGRYLRNPDTGELVRVDDNGNPEEQ